MPRNAVFFQNRRGFSRFLPAERRVGRILATRFGVVYDSLVDSSLHHPETRVRTMSNQEPSRPDGSTRSSINAAATRRSSWSRASTPIFLPGRKWPSASPSCRPTRFVEFMAVRLGDEAFMLAALLPGHSQVNGKAFTFDATPAPSIVAAGGHANLSLIDRPENPHAGPRHRTRAEADRCRWSSCRSSA